MKKRRVLREYVVQALYAAEVAGDSLEHVLKTVIQEPQKLNKRWEDEDDEQTADSAEEESRQKAEKQESPLLRNNFSEKLFLRTIRNRDELNEIIQRQVNNWDMGRLAVIDKQILRMALCEFIYFEDIPTKVTINEAIEIAKKYSTEKSGKFINGILDAALNELREEGRISKSGRGLIGSEHSEE